MGGRRNKHQLSNVVWLESDINGLIESDPAMAAEARLRGIKISVHATDPSEVPILHAVHGLVTLTNNVNDEHGGVKRIIHTRKEH
ncbi:hypothetical protein [Plantibacter sp. YIM 135249]|uniref:hypothetical protein n=1 Tax=Plantibacter sp. YIM 135249 TaxID=3423918 RepID=UPI003D350137